MVILISTYTRNYWFNRNKPTTEYNYRAAGFNPAITPYKRRQSFQVCLTLPDDKGEFPSLNCVEYFGIFADYFYSFEFFA